MALVALQPSGGDYETAADRRGVGRRRGQVGAVGDGDEATARKPERCAIVLDLKFCDGNECSCTREQRAQQPQLRPRIAFRTREECPPPWNVTTYGIRARAAAVIASGATSV